MNRSIAVERLAAIAHDLWRSAMAERGWSSGERDSPAAREHHAMAPWDQLSAEDRAEIIWALEIAGISAQLAALVERARANWRPFRPGDLALGQRVVHADVPSDVGSIESWELETGQAAVRIIRVRWDDGSVTEHHPCEGELLRL